MAQIRAAFFDIDGTLLPFHAKALPESTVQALAALLSLIHISEPTRH